MHRIDEPMASTSPGTAADTKDKTAIIIGVAAGVVALAVLAAFLIKRYRSRNYRS